MNPLSWTSGDGTGNDRLRVAAAGEAKWCTEVQLWRPAAQDAITTGEGETCVVLLSGTFDLHGGPTVWQARGARTTPLEGRPMAVFLPPRTTFRAENGTGEILLVSARQPQIAAPTEGRAAFGQKPLLPMAGSGKSFDPNSGEWRPAETFPTAPESLPPRRMQRLPVGAVTIERVFAPDYKAATLSLDEVVLAAGTSLRVQEIPGLPPAVEVLLFVRSEGSSRITHAGTTTHAPCGDRAFCADSLDLTIEAVGGRSYVLLAYAGKTLH